MSGARGGPAAAREPEQAEDQPRQGSRRNDGHGEPPETRKSFAPGQAPSGQGRGEPRPRQIGRHQQGISQRSGTHAPGREERAEESSERGEPAPGHVREGRQHTPGDRPRG